MKPHGADRYTRFADFYPFYLEQHSNLVCRRLHYAGSLLILGLIAYVLFSQRWVLLLFIPLLGYGFAWIGHFIFEKNRPATFQYPFYSLLGDWVMLKDALTGRIRF